MEISDNSGRLSINSSFQIPFTLIEKVPHAAALGLFNIPGHFYGGFFLLNVGEVSGIFSRCVDGFVDIRMLI